MINVSAAISTPPPRGTGTTAPAIASTGEFRDTLDGLGEIVAPNPDVAGLFATTKQPAPIARNSAMALIIDPPVRNNSKAIIRLVKPIAIEAATPPDPAICILPAATGKRQKIAGDGNVLPAELADKGPPRDPLWSPPVIAQPEHASAVRPLAVSGGAAASEGEAVAASPASSPVEAGPQMDEARAALPASPDPAPAFSEEQVAEGAAKAAIPENGIDDLPAELADKDRARDPLWSPPVIAQPEHAPAVRPLTVSGGVTASVGKAGAANPARSPAEAGGQPDEARPASPASPDRAPVSAGEQAAGEGTGKAALSRDGNTVPVAQTIEPKPDLPVRMEATTTFIPQSSQPVHTVALPAGQAFAAAIAAVVQAGRDDGDPAETRMPLTIATAPLDLRQNTGLPGLIDHVEVLRDGADASDTRIQLSPDAPGDVDVSIRDDGDGVHVRVNTDAGGAAGKAVIPKDGIAVPIARMIEPKPDLPVRMQTATSAAPQASPPAPPITLPAGQVFAAAIAAAVQARRDDGDPVETRTPLAIATAALDAVHSPTIAATADVRQAALDLRQDSGLQAMIDHIEVLRDGADAGDTRIRLSPDALGGVDVSVRKEGDRVHVHFNTDNQASARLLSDAQPRLAELAEARGVKLGQTSVETGGGNARQQAQPAKPILSTTPVAASDLADTATDLRVA